MCLYDLRENPRILHKRDPLWKVASILDELPKNAQHCRVTGQFVAIDEQTIGFKRKHGLALRISYKREGDGYQCDALCEDGYTFSFYFRHGDALDVPDELKYLNLSPTAWRVVFLMMQLPNQWTHVYMDNYMDNLINSHKLFTAGYHVKVLGHGVCRTYGCGLCEATIQKTETDIKKADLLRGSTKCAILQDDETCPN